MTRRSKVIDLYPLVIGASELEAPEKKNVVYAFNVFYWGNLFKFHEYNIDMKDRRNFLVGFFRDQISKDLFEDFEELYRLRGKEFGVDLYHPGYQIINGFPIIGKNNVFCPASNIDGNLIGHLRDSIDKKVDFMLSSP